MRSSDAWNRAPDHEGVPVDGGAWQAPQSAVTIGPPVGMAFTQATASCLISPLAGVRAGIVGAGPTKPVGKVAVEWHSLQVLGCGMPRPKSDAWNTPG